MAELVEHRHDVVVADQRRLACRRFREIADVVHDRLIAEQSRLLHEAVFPRAAGFVVALEIVGVPQRQRRAVFVEHFEHAHVGLIDGKVVTFLERESVQLVRGEEHAVLQHAVEHEILLDFVFVDLEFVLLHLLGIELPIPRREFETAFLLVDDGLHFAASPFAFATAAGTMSVISLIACSGDLAI